MDYNGTVVLGSSALQTSVAEQEICADGVGYINFSLLNDYDCHISFNGGDYIYLRALQGIQLDVVNSCKILEDGITYNFVGVKG